jgi:acyl-[acyl-carrier-protein] desaturase
MVQELATFVHYRNLRRVAEERGDPALVRLLGLVSVDERAHHAFYRSVVQLFLEVDRKETLEQLKRVLLTFAMPAVHFLAESRRRVEQIKNLGIFDEDVFLHEVYQPILTALNIHHRELRGDRPARKSKVEE